VDDIDSVGDQVTTAFQRAIDVEKADVIFSGYHLTSSPEFDICANAGVLYYNNNTQKAWTDRYQSNPEKYWSIFQTDPNDEWYGGGFARYLNMLVETGQFVPRAARRPPSCTVMTPIAPLSAPPLSPRPRSWVGRSCMWTSFTVGQVADWGPMLSKVRDANPSVFFSVTYNPADNAAMIKQWVANPIDA